ncbi:hypothetical protein [Clostridium sp.]|uniref:hypothetical protein n=1 Tax=Clostridium sp. TaxID=1506 RepID=UPI0026144217|nr:hypothetical protein [Clostridium sp.]
MKKDKGIELIYWNLSYRRKLIRTLWWTPLSVVALSLLWTLNSNIIFKIIATILIILMNLIQLTYNYIKWKRDEKSS